jgi:hypothetical protein
VRRAAGQVAREAHRVVHYLLAFCMVLLMALAALGWKLSQGPMEVEFLARAIEQAYNTPDRDGRIDIGHATLAWEGLRGEGMTPLEVRLTGTRLLGADGAVRAEMPDAAISLSIPWLLRGELAPRRLELREPVLRLRRDEEGRISVRLAAPRDTAPEGIEGSAAPLEELLADMMAPPHDNTPLSALGLISVVGARVMVEDASLRAAWSLDDVNVELRRLPQGGVTGRGSAVARLGEQRLRIAIGAEARGEPMQLTLRASLPELHPAELAALGPELAPLAALDAPSRLDVTTRIDGDWRIQGIGVSLRARHGAVDLGAGRRIPVAGLEAQAEWSRAALRLPRVSVRLDGPGMPTLLAEGEATRTDGTWHAKARLRLDAAPVAALSRWWPEGVGTGERAWILENITAGTARNGRWEVEAEAGADLSGFRVTSLAGTLDVEDATVHWLRPVPPVEQARGQVAFSLEEVTVRVAGARQSGTQVQARDSTLRILIAPDGSATTEMQIGLAGPVPDVMGVLQHPRLGLFNGRPLPVKDPQGSLDGRVTLNFPLTESVPIESVRIRAQAQLRQVRIADAFMGRPLERGQFEINVTNDGLRASGNAVLAEIAARIGVEMDFRRGNATQVVMRETVQARADARQLAALGLANEEVVRGPVGLDVRVERRRNGQGRANVRADLREATLDIEALGWSKPPGQNAGGEAVLRLAGESLDAIESFRVEAPSLLLRGNVAFARGTRLERVAITEGRVEASRFTAEARPPARADAPWSVALRGQVIDLQRKMAEETPAGPPPAGSTSPAVALEARFDRLLLGPGRELAAIEARVTLDEHGVLRDGRVSGRAGATGGFEATLAQQGQGRALRLTADNAGALLHAFDVLPHLEGGRLTVTAAYAHNGRGAPLTGSAEMNDFSVRNAPGFAKLLQAMTLFGLVEALSGPGLGFSRLVAPFTLTPEALTLDDARAFSASLGLTARGTLHRRTKRVAMEGTIVPAYIFNSLLGNIPVLGRIFSPEAGGGLFAATFRMNGAMDDPQVSVNPLAALTPGFLRGLFGGSLGPPPQ